MLSFSEDNEDGFSLLDCVRPDGSIDLQRALNFLTDVEDECHVDESSVFSCMNAEGGLDLAKFLQVADTASLLELSILKEAGLLDDANTPTGATIETPLRPYKPRRMYPLRCSGWNLDLIQEIMMNQDWVLVMTGKIWS